MLPQQNRTNLFGRELNLVLGIKLVIQTLSGIFSNNMYMYIMNTYAFLNWHSCNFLWSSGLGQIGIFLSGIGEKKKQHQFSRNLVEFQPQISVIKSSVPFRTDSPLKMRQQQFWQLPPSHKSIHSHSSKYSEAIPAIICLYNVAVTSVQHDQMLHLLPHCRINELHNTIYWKILI